MFDDLSCVKYHDLMSSRCELVRRLGLSEQQRRSPGSCSRRRSSSNPSRQAAKRRRSGEDRRRDREGDGRQAKPAAGADPIDRSFSQGAEAPLTPSNSPAEARPQTEVALLRSAGATAAAPAVSQTLADHDLKTGET